MRRIILSMVGGLGVVGLAVLAAGGQACGSDACVKDTDCDFPNICAAGACMRPPPKGDVSFPDVTPDGPDGDADVDVDVPDADDDGGAETETGCTPVTSLARRVMDTAANADEHPMALRSAAAFVFFGCALVGTSENLRFMRVRLDGGGSPATQPLSGVDFSGRHPLIELPDGRFAMAFYLPTGSPGIWLKITQSDGATGAPPQQVPGTDEGSGDPALTWDGENIVIAYAHQAAAGDSMAMRVHKFDPSTGAPVGSDSVTVASGAAGTREPRIAWGASRHALAYYNATDERLHVLVLAADLSVTADHPMGMEPGHAFVGHPDIDWGGSRFAVVWETAGPSNASLRLAVFGEGDAPVPVEALTGVPLASTEMGHVSVAWGAAESELGIAWRYSQTGSVNAALARVRIPSMTLIEGPVVINTGATTANFPDVAFNANYYMLTWAEVSGTQYPVFAATRGCVP
jgi:hypothetical protein